MFRSLGFKIAGSHSNMHPSIGGGVLLQGGSLV